MRTLQLIPISEKEKETLLALSQANAVTLNELCDKALLLVLDGKRTEIQEIKKKGLPRRLDSIWFDDNVLQRFDLFCERNGLDLRSTIQQSIIHYITSRNI